MLVTSNLDSLDKSSVTTSHGHSFCRPASAELLTWPHLLTPHRKAETLSILISFEFACSLVIRGIILSPTLYLSLETSTGSLLFSPVFIFLCPYCISFCTTQSTSSYLPFQKKHVVHFSVQDHWKKKEISTALIYAWRRVDAKAVLVTGSFAVPCKDKLRHRFQKV